MDGDAFVEPRSGPTITQGWNAMVRPSGGRITATNVSYSATSRLGSP